MLQLNTTMKNETKFGWGILDAESITFIITGAYVVSVKRHKCELETDSQNQ